MCGYICLWKIDNLNLAHRMIDRIAHRGPDDVRVSRALNAPVVMAHCRLAIIGPENGTQPISNDEDMLVANGEIYNHADLRTILGESAFETQSDSETICTFSARKKFDGLPDSMACSHLFWRLRIESSLHAIRLASNQCSWRALAKALPLHRS